MSSISRKLLYLLWIVVLSAIAVGIGINSSHPVIAQEENENEAIRSLSVTGIGTTSGSPDIAYFDVGVEIENADVGTAVEQVNTIMDAVIVALNEDSIAEEDIRTTNFNVRQDHTSPDASDRLGLGTQQA